MSLNDDPNLFDNSSTEYWCTVKSAHFRFQDYEYVSFQPLALLPHWHYPHVTTLCIVTHFGSFLQPFSLHVILCEKNIEIWIILFSPWIILFSPYSWVYFGSAYGHFENLCLISAVQYEIGSTHVIFLCNVQKNPINLKGTSCSPLCKIVMYKTYVKKILKFELYCFLLELSCFLPIHDIFPCFMFVLYITILHKGEQLVPFKFIGFSKF
jgi:hypothetical protein